jgi:hypothetical protein
MTRTLSTVLDRLTPRRLRVCYGPAARAPGSHSWTCGRCVRRGYTRSLAAARAQAEQHASGHRFMRAVYDEG